MGLSYVLWVGWVGVVTWHCSLQNTPASLILEGTCCGRTREAMRPLGMHKLQLQLESLVCKYFIIRSRYIFRQDVYINKEGWEWAL